MFKFDPIFRDSGYYHRSLSVIYILLCLVFIFAGVVAFGFDSVTLPGRTQAVEFSGKWAHGVGVVSFHIAAYWIYLSLKEYRASLPTLLAPFVIATAVSVTLLAGKYF